MNPETPPRAASHFVTLTALGVAAFALYGWQQADKRAFNAVAISGNGQVTQRMVQAIGQIDKAVGSLNARIKALEAPPAPAIGAISAALTSTNPAPTTNQPAK